LFTAWPSGTSASWVAGSRRTRASVMPNFDNRPTRMSSNSASSSSPAMEEVTAGVSETVSA